MLIMLNRTSHWSVTRPGLILLAAATRLAAQTETAPATPKVLYACYGPLTGTVYRIREPGLSADCLGPKAGPHQHVEFNWTDGTQPQGVIRNGDAAGGDLASTFPNPKVIALNGRPVSSASPGIGQVLSFDGSSWTPATPPAAVACNQCVASGTNATAFGIKTKASGDNSTAIGSHTAASGESSTAMGLGTTASGEGSTAMGTGTTASGQYSTAMGSNTTASGNYSTAMGVYATTNGKLGAFVYGDLSSGDTQANVTAEAHNEFVVRAAGGFRFRTSADLSTGCNLPAGSGTWSCTSSRYLKTNIAAVDRDALLRRIASVPVTTWRYRSENAAVRHLGPMAQDFRAAFGLGVDDTSIGLLDISGVTFAGVQALGTRTERLQRENAELRAQISDLERRLARLEESRKQEAKPSQFRPN